MTREETFKKTFDAISLSVEKFNTKVEIRASDMWSKILKVVKTLETDDNGAILISTKNLKVLRTLRNDLEKTIVTPAYKKNLNSFLNSFDELKTINDTYYKSIASFSTNKHVFNTIKNLSVDSTKNSLLESGIASEVITPIEKILQDNITTGGNITDLIESLRTDIIGDSERLGRLERYSKQITTDALNQYNANYNQAVSNDLGMEFYYYSGAIKTNSRSYCKDMVSKGRYFHKKEVEQSSTQIWSGKIPNTNSSTIFINRGGYNCGHQWLAVQTEDVPKSAISRNIANGNYKPIE